MWTDAALDELVSLRLPNGLAVIFTEGAWGRDRERSRRWLDRGFDGDPGGDPVGEPAGDDRARCSSSRPRSAGTVS